MRNVGASRLRAWGSGMVLVPLVVWSSPAWSEVIPPAPPQMIWIHEGGRFQLVPTPPATGPHMRLRGEWVPDPAVPPGHTWQPAHWGAGMKWIPGYWVPSGLPGTEVGDRNPEGSEPLLWTSPRTREREPGFRIWIPGHFRNGVWIPGQWRGQ